jgi:methionine-rich copper-binding protein CopC
LFEAISVSSSQVSGYNSSTITINPSSDLIAGTDYYVLIDATAIDDTSGNSFAGIASKTTWNFTASDLVAPTLSYLSPGDNATDVAVDAIFEINFSEAIATGTGNIVIYKSSDDSIAESIDISGAKVTASGTTALLINPTLTLEGETEYYIIIPNTAVDDLSANSYAGITASSTWSFTTVDNNNPGVSYFNPQDNSSSVALNQIFEINFNETIVVGSGNIVLYKSSDDSIVESIDISGVKVTASGTSALLIDPAATLESETEYYFIFPATGVDDTSGNSFVGISASSTWSFTSGDYSNPTLSYLNPNDNATAVEIDAVFEINFNEAIATGTGNIVIYKTSDDSVVESIAVGSSKITASGTTALLINPATDLSYETEYYIIIPATAIDDTSGNSYAGITASSTWSFTSKDTPTCPTVSHAATYNPYPTCGVATCESGYTLSNGSCIIVSSGSGGSSAVTNNTTTVGSGSVDTSIPAQKTKEVGRVETSGINAVMHLDSKAIFQAQVSKTNTIQNHGITIKEMDLNLQKVHILIESDPIEFDLSLYETKLVDLDGDGINDIEVTFANLVVNNSEITIKELNSPVADNIKNDNSVNSYIITDDELYERLKGKIILKVEGKGEAYYISSTKKEMYYLGRPSDAFEILRNQGIGITNEDLLRISEINSDDLADFVFCKKHLGKIFLQVEQNGEAWYVNPANEKRYYLGQPTDAFNLMKNLALGISNKDFAKLIE